MHILIELHIKQGIKNFTALIELDLSDNNITALPAELVCFFPSNF
jgi:Leucine-rich repeat (LRR) protein